MAVRNVIQYPAKILMKPVKRVGKKELIDLPALIQDMKDTVEAEKGVGLAAPQIGAPYRVMLAFNLEREQLEVYINPTIVASEGEELGEEGCLSFRGLVGLIPRATKIKVKYCDTSLKENVAVLDGLSARIVQHEIDHLNGITIKDRSVVELYKPKVEERESTSRVEVMG